MKKLLVLLAVLTSLAVPSRASVVFSDTFSYPNGNLVGAAGSPWANHSGTTPILVVNGKAQLTGGNSEDANALLTGQPYDTVNNPSVGYLYSSMSVTVSNLPGAAGNYISHFKDSGTFNFRCRVYLLTTGAAASKFRFGIASTNSASTTTGFVSWATDSDLGVPYTVVTRYNITNGESVLWINPATEDSLAITNVPPNPDSIIQIAAYAMRQASGEGTSYIDNLKIATRFVDIAGDNTAPTISSIPNQSIPANGNTGPIAFTVEDAESAGSSLTVTASSSNTGLVPNGSPNIVLAPGDGTNRTITVIPAAGQQGSTTITVDVNDGANSSFTTFQVTVGAPVVSAIPNQIAVSNTPIPAISFTVVDTEGDTLTPTKSSSNPTLLQDANITIGGSGSSRTLTVVPEPNQIGVTTVTIGFGDGINTTTRSFVLTARPLIGVLLSEQFAYTTFPFFPNALYQADGSPWQTASGTAYQIQVTNGWAYIGRTNSEDVAASLTNGPFAASNGVVFYSSFTLRVTSLPAGVGNYFAHLKDTLTGSSFRARVFVNTNGAGAGNYRIGIANQAGTGAYYPLDCSLNSDYLVVTRYNGGTGESVLWVNPYTESSPSVAGTDTPLTSSISAYGLREDNNPTTGDLQICNLVVSTSFPIIPVPAPITITGISVSGGTVTINFTAGASDSASGFDAISSGTVNGTYTPASAVISNPSSGIFQATLSTAGSAQFYRIKRK